MVLVAGVGDPASPIESSALLKKSSTEDGIKPSSKNAGSIMVLLALRTVAPVTVYVPVAPVRGIVKVVVLVTVTTRTPLGSGPADCVIPLINTELPVVNP